MKLQLILVSLVTVFFGICCDGGGSSKPDQPPLVLFDGFRIEGQKWVSGTSVMGGGIVVIDTKDNDATFATADQASLKDGKWHLEGNVSSEAIGRAQLSGGSMVLGKGRKIAVPGSSRMVLPARDE